MNFALDDLDCPPGALELEDCTYRESHNCLSDEAIELTCGGPAFTLDAQGVLKYGSGYVCDDLFDANEADMVCASMGLGEAESFEPAQTIARLVYEGFTMDNLECPAGATTLE